MVNHVAAIRVSKSAVLLASYSHRVRKTEQTSINIDVTAASQAINRLELTILIVHCLCEIYSLEHSYIESYY